MSEDFNKKYKSHSIWLSYLLRHGAKDQKVKIDKQAFVLVDDVIEASKKAEYEIDLDILKAIVANDQKGRYSFNEDFTKIRANQGHSMEVNPGLAKAVPPVILYHGTSKEAWEIIKKKGLNKMTRTHVHLTGDIELARKRFRKTVVIEVDAKAMLADKVDFYKSANDVWLVDAVDPKYLKLVN
jgi:putative RNA 2'-phosphotransferase